MLAALLLAVAAALGSCGASASTQGLAAAPAPHPCGRFGPRPARYDHVVWIVMENKSYSDVMRSPSAPYLRALGAACGVATRFRGETHPSLPNYLAMTSGSTHGVRDDGPPSQHPLRGPSIFSQLGSDWRALQESMPRACYRGNTLRYAVKHNPAAYFRNLARSCASRDVALRGTPDLSAHFTFITPNRCHDTHDCGIGTGDRFLARLVSRIVATSEYRAGRTALFVTYDEDDGSSGNHIPTIVVSPQTRAGTRSAARFNHYSLLRTTEEMLGLGRLGAAAHARSMRHAFGL